jgi:hypothetical protein
MSSSSLYFSNLSALFTNTPPPPLKDKQLVFSHSHRLKRGPFSRVIKDIFKKEALVVSKQPNFSLNLYKKISSRLMSKL